jgi:putative cell wall-binding protein
MEQHRVRRRRASAVIVASSLFAGFLALAPRADATADVESTRIAGADRFATAAAVADAAFPDGSSTVLVANGRGFADALAGATLGLPILLTEANTLPKVTADAVDSLGADSVIILGGTAAVSKNVEQALASHADVSRIAGVDRYDTAAKIASSVGASKVGTVDGRKTAIIATGLNPADALAGGPLATGAAGSTALPILLVSSDVPDATSQAIDDLGIGQVIILGGTGAVSSTVESELEDQTGSNAVRLAGADRYATAAAVGEFAIDTLDFAATDVILANGLNPADALAGGPLGAVRQAPIALTDPAELPQSSESFIADHSGTIDTVLTLGGTAAVSPSASDAAVAAAETPPATRKNEAIAVAPTTVANQANGSSRTYTVSGVTSPVDIVLVPCNLVQTDSSGNTLFSDSDSDHIADGTADSASDADNADTPAYISDTNGDTQVQDENHDVFDDDYADDVAPDSAHRITFTVTGPSSSSISSSCIIPVVFSDVNSDDALDLSTTNARVPSEVFGTGGETRFSPGAAASGIFNVNVDDNNDSLDTFSGCKITADLGGNDEVIDSTKCASYHYDANDTFQIAGQPTTMSIFETTLSVDDDVKGTYATTTAGISVFNLSHNDAPEPPTEDPTGSSEVSGSTVTLHLIESATPTTDHYRLYRYTRVATDTACPAFSASKYTYLAESRVVDPNPGGAPPSPKSRFDMTDATAPTGTNCYVPISEEGFGEGPAGDPISVVVAVGATTTTTSTTSTTLVAGTPVISTAKGASTDTVLSAGDTHELVFSKAMTQATDATYDVKDGDSPNPASAKITCGGNALCTWLNSTTLRVKITKTPSITDPTSGLTNPGTDGDVNYPLTITASTFKDQGTASVALSGSDTTIEKDTLAGDVTSPMISTALLTTDAGADHNFGLVGDVMKLTFNDSVLEYVANPASVTETEFEAIVGRSVQYATGTVVTMTPAHDVSSSDVTFTVSGQSFTSGINTGQPIPGTSTNLVRDAAGNPEQANPSPTNLT